MFKSWWQRVFSNNRKSATALSLRRRNRVRLHLDRLEDRLVPAVDLTAVQSATGLLTLTETSATGLAITVTEAANFGELTVSVPNGNTITGGGTTFTTQKPVTALTVNLSSGPDLLTIGDSSFAQTLTLPGALIINGTGGPKMINIDNVNLLNAAPLTMSLAGGNAQNFSDTTTTFTNVNVGGAATIKHPGLGMDDVIITNNQPAGPKAVFHWGSLSITNATTGTSNSTTINDTNFTGNVTINNGAASDVAGGTGNTTIIQAKNDQTLATIRGSLTVTSTAGPVDTELNDYNVGGSVTMSASGTVNALSTGTGKVSFGIEDNPTDAGSVPAIGGSVTINDTTKLNSSIPGNPFGTIDINVGAGHPLVIHGNLTLSGMDTTPPPNVVPNQNITVPGVAYAINLTDLKMAAGTASITLVKTSGSNTITIGADNSGTSDYGALNITYSSTGFLDFDNTFAIQQAAGELDVARSVNLQVDGNFSPSANPPFLPPYQLGIGPLAIGSGGGKVNIGGNLTIAGTDDKQILVQHTRVNGNLTYNLNGNDWLDAEFTDSSVAGAASIADIMNYGFLASLVNITSTGSVPLKWGSLSLNTSYDSAVTINDTDFAGNVTINAAGNTNGGFGGYNPITTNLIILAAKSDTSLATIGGNLTITSGANVPMFTQVEDYNVVGNVTISQAALASGTASSPISEMSVGVEDAAATLPGIPFIGGNLTVTATSGKDAQAGKAVVNIGTGNPLLIDGNLTITGSGPNVAVNLQDVSVPSGTTSVTLGGTAVGGDSVQVLGSSVTSVFNIFNLTASAGGNNSFSFQDQAGTLVLGGSVSIQLNGSSTNTVNVGADTNNDTGVANAVVDLFGTTNVTSLKKGNTFFGAPGGNPNANISFFVSPKISNFTLS